jgi:type II secretory pathway pseudopilin PulG
MRPSACGSPCSLLRRWPIGGPRVRTQPTGTASRQGPLRPFRNDGLMVVPRPLRWPGRTASRPRASTLAFSGRNGRAQRLRHRPGYGLTLIELMVLLVVMGILALIVIPRVLGAARRSNEAALRGDLRNFRVAIERFQADCGGYPPRLDDILAWRGQDVSASADGAGHSLDLGSYRGPYLRTGDMLLPCDPITDGRDWRYDSAAGEVHSASGRVGTNGTPYTSW